jgi:putative endonuclease
MPHFVYIIYSPGYERFYIGETRNLDNRLKAHNNGTYHGSSTAFTSDWEIYLILECDDIRHARAVEFHIKKMKSRQYKFNLKAYPEMRRILIEKYKQRSAPR